MITLADMITWQKMHRDAYIRERDISRAGGTTSEYYENYIQGQLEHLDDKTACLERALNLSPDCERERMASK